MKTLREEIFDIVISNYNGGDLVGMKQVFQDTLTEVVKRIDDYESSLPIHLLIQEKETLRKVKEMLK